MFRELFEAEKLKCPSCGKKAKMREDGQNAECLNKKCDFGKDELSKFKGK